MEFVRTQLAAGRAGVVLAGAPGVGKSRLAREVLREVAAADDAYEWVTGTRSATDIPLGAFAHLLPLSGALPTDRLELLQQAAGAIAERAGGGRLILGVDDAHVLDDVSATLLRGLAAARSVSLVVTVRSGEPAPDAVTGLWKDDLLVRLDLQELARIEMASLLESALGGPVGEGAVARLAEMSGGNVLMLRELVLDALDSGTLAVDNHLWQWSGVVTGGVRLSEVVLNRIGTLLDADRRLLELLALAEPLSVEAIGEVVPEASVAEAERRGLVTVERAGLRSEVRLAHPLYGEVLVGQLGEVDRQRHFSTLAARVERYGARRAGDALRLGVWHLEGAIASPGSDVLAAAAAVANLSFDQALAERLARASLEGGSNFEAGLALGRSLIDQGRAAAADEVLEGLEVTAPDDEGRALVAIERMQSLHWGLGRTEDALATLEAAEAAIADDTWRMLVRGFRANLLGMTGHISAAGELAAELFAPGVDDRVRVRALGPVAIPLVLSGRATAATDAANQVIGAAMKMEGELRGATASVALVHFAAAIIEGRLENAGNFIDAAQQLRESRTPYGQALLQFFRGRLLLYRGEVASAERNLREAASEFRRDPFRGPSMMSYCLSVTAEAAALRGDFRAAEAALSEAARHLDRGLEMYEPDARRGRAWGRVGRGEITAASEELLVLAAELREREIYAFEMLTLHGALRLGRVTETAERLVELGTVVDGHWAAAFSAHAAALVDEDPEALEAAAALFEAMGARLHAAEVFAQAARAFDDRGLKARAAACARHSRSHEAACEGARTPLLSASIEPVPLTRREREVAHLAARGLTNQEIAERLTVSVRTVEGHMYQAFAKLGISDRRDLASALG